MFRIGEGPGDGALPQYFQMQRARRCQVTIIKTQKRRAAMTMARMATIITGTAMATTMATAITTTIPS